MKISHYVVHKRLEYFGHGKNAQYKNPSAHTVISF